MPTTKTKTPTLTVSQQSLSSAIATVLPAVPARPSQPILANLKLEITAGRIHLTAFNPSHSIAISIECDTAGIPPQSFCIPARYFYDVVGVLKGNLSISIDGSLFRVVAGKSKYEFQTLPADSFPALPVVEAEPISLIADSMRQLLSTEFASSSDETKQVLCGVFLHFEGHTAQSAATDGHRLAWTEIDLPYAVDRPYSFVLPANVASLLLRVASDDNIDLQIGDDNLSIATGDITITSRLLLGQYPNYRQLIPNQFARTIAVNRADLLGALQRISVVASQCKKDKEGRGKTVKIEAEANSLTISAFGINAEEGREEIECQLTGDPISFAGEAIYLIDALKANNSSEYRIQCNTPLSPIVFSTLSSSGESVQSLMMPIQVKN